MIARTIIANICGGVLTVGLTLLAVPVQTHLLGIESYGLLAFLASLQTLASVLDLGLGMTAVREIASDHSPQGRDSAPLLVMLQCAYWGMGITVGAILYVSASAISSHWLHAGSIDPAMATHAIELTGITLAIRWPVAFYAGVLTGLQRLDTLNLLKIASTLMRLGGGILVLILVPKLEALLIWMIAIAILEVVAMAVACRSLHPAIAGMPRWNGDAVRRVWKYAVAVNIIAVQSILITQADRLILGKLVPASELGHYAVAYNLSMGISLVQGFMTVAMMPALSADAGAGRSGQMRKRFEKGTQLLLISCALPAGCMTFFGQELLSYLIVPEIAARAAPILSCLSIGFLMSSISALPFTLALAVGRTRPALILNSIVPVLYLPLLWVLTGSYGGMGCAYAWMGLNIIYLLVFPRLVLGPVLGIRTGEWLRRCVVPFVVLSLLIFAAARLLLDGCSITAPIAVAGMALGAGLVFLATCFPFLDGDLRKRFTDAARRLIIH